MSESARRARERFDRPELAPLWCALRERLERSSGPVRRVNVRCETPEQRAALADLLGWDRLPDERATVSVRQLDDVLLESPAGLDSRGVVEAVGGVVDNLADQRRHRHVARERLWCWLAGHPYVVEHPELAGWVGYARGNGLVDGSVETTRELLENALTVLEALPAGGEPLPALAERLRGDPHALDDDRRLSTYVLRALASSYGEPPPASAGERRSLWQRAGVECDTLSASVLVAGLRPAGHGPLAHTMRLWAAAGHACRLTLAQLWADPLVDIAGSSAWIVENPSVVATALDRFGTRCPPLVCTSGWPNGAVLELLRQMGACGTALHCHADLDGEGLGIVDHVVTKVGARPWRMAASDYLAAVPATGPGVGRVPDVRWEPALAEVVAARGVAVYEERVVGDLLADLEPLR